MDLPSIEELYPYEVRVKPDTDLVATGLKVVKFLEANNIMNNVDFQLELFKYTDRVAFRFRKKKAAKFLKEHKKAIRETI